MISYNYDIDQNLHALNEGAMGRQEWEEMGKPCIFVIYDTPLAKGFFVVKYDDLVAFNESDIDYSNESKVLDVFTEMLKVENYVENLFLSEGGDVA